jgi:hypothetical protein
MLWGGPVVDRLRSVGRMELCGRSVETPRMVSLGILQGDKLS